MKFSPRPYHDPIALGADLVRSDLVASDGRPATETPGWTTEHHEGPYRTAGEMMLTVFTGSGRVVVETSTGKQTEVESPGDARPTTTGRGPP